MSGDEEQGIPFPPINVSDDEQLRAAVISMVKRYHQEGRLSAIMRSNPSAWSLGDHCVIKGVIAFVMAGIVRGDYR